MSFLESEIREQPQALMALLDREAEKARRIAADLRARKIKYVIIAARGTSDNAARYGQYLLGAYNRLPVGLATPSLYSVYREPPCCPVPWATTRSAWRRCGASPSPSSASWVARS
jgi:glucosamine--fructose-6-phosphate aminotransferase (isomerizing)